MKKLSMLALQLAICVACAAQSLPQPWYFGTQAALLFSGTPATPSAITTGQTNTFEGTAVATDVNGNMIFYTDGVNIWNQNNVLINPSQPLFGNPSSTNAALIVPKPGSCDTFFVFTTDAAENYGTAAYKGLRVSMVRWTGTTVVLPGGQTNFLLRAGSTEKLAAVKNGNNSYWVMSHDFPNSDTFRAFRITQTNTSVTSFAAPSSTVTSKAGSVHTNMQGQMKFSLSGSRLGLAVNIQSLVGCYGFNMTTGVVSVTPAINGENTTFNASCNAGYIYGLEFSPDEQKMYTTRLFSSCGNSVLQFDVTTPAWQTATVPGIVVGTLTTAQQCNAYGLGGMQIAPNGQIYIAKRDCNNLAAITNPNTLGTLCNFAATATGTTLSPGLCRLTLPAVISKPSSNPALANNLEAYYTFTNGSLADITGNGHNGTAIGASVIPTTDAQNKPNCAYSFSGVAGEYIQIPSSTAFDYMGLPCSFTAWYKPASTNPSNYELLVGRGLGLHCPDTYGDYSLGLYDCRMPVLGIDAASCWEMYVNGLFPFQNNCTARLNYYLNQGWQFVAGVYDPNNTVAPMTVYWNTIPSSNLHNSGCPPGTPVTMNVGNMYIGADYTGKIDEVRIYSRAITAAEVNQLYALGIRECCHSQTPPTQRIAATDIDFEMYPNPTGGKFTVQVPADLVGGTLSVSDMTGRLLQQRTILSAHSVIDLGTLPAGPYIVTYRSAGMRTTKKIVKL